MQRKLIKSPESIVLAITGRCNLSCKYCFYADEMKALDDLPTKTWLSFFEECRDAGILRLTLTGGEVFTRSDFWDLIEGIVRNKMRFSILTNGTLITNHVIRKLVQYRHRLDYIQVSVDGSCAETHDQIRGKGSFDKMMRGIGFLKEYRMPWVVRVTINKLNIYDLEDTLNLLYNDLGLKRFDVNEAFPRGAGHCNNSTLEMTREERRLSFKIMEEFDKRYPGVTSGGQSGPLVIANFIEKVNKARNNGKFDVPYKTGYLTGCNIMWHKISVLHDGTYVPCHQLPHIHLGTVGKDSLVEVWQKSPKLIKLRERENIPLESIAHCKGCEYQKYCTGGCPGIAYALTGEVNNINPSDCYRAYIGEDPDYKY